MVAGARSGMNLPDLPPTEIGRRSCHDRAMSSHRQNHHSASPYEATVGFSRAVRVGHRILVAGTAPIEPDGTSTPGDAYRQAQHRQ